MRHVAHARLTPHALTTRTATAGRLARTVGRGGVGISAALAAANVVSTYRAEGHVGTRTRHAAGRGVGGVAGGLAGAKLGGALGATIGTAIAPGIGTAIGGGIGAVTGAIVGAHLGSHAGDAVVSAGEHVAHTAKKLLTKFNPF
ncbi:MAG: hypothetical protein JWL76_742 [Thermoleophilia bacterium]|nr:hypothetical protein [Thermoleophilia bacterium]